MLIGKRQIFVRFAGCNIDCKYCDTQNSKSVENGEYYTFDQLNNRIQSIMTPDFDSLEITGGEPLLHSDYIKNFLSEYNYKAMLETNATLPENLRDLADVIDIVSMDIKLPEHFLNEDEWSDVYEKELQSIEIMEDNNIKYYIKIVVSQTTSTKIIEDIIKDLLPRVNSDVEIILQPVSPISSWKSKKNLFTLSEIIGKNFKVSIIPQIHKYMEIE